MAEIGDALATTAPAVGTPGTGYASTINTLLTELRARLIVKVPLSAIDGTRTTSSDLDMNNQPFENVKYVGLYPQAVTPASTPLPRLESYDGNLYYVDTSGPVQITSGSGLNAAGIGGIGGDYGTGPEQVVFVNADERYEFYDDFGATQWAILKFKEWEAINEGGNTISVLPGTPTASYNLTLPPNDPAAGVSVLTLSSTGLMQLGETAPITNAFSIGAVATFTADPVLSGATKFKHGNRVMQIPCTVDFAAGTASAETAVGVVAGGTTSEFGTRLKGLEVGTRIISVTLRMEKAGTNDTVATLKYIDASGAVQTVAGATVTDATSGLRTLTMTPTSPETVVTNQGYYVHVECGDGTDEHYIFQVTYDRTA